MKAKSRKLLHFDIILFILLSTCKEIHLSLLYLFTVVSYTFLPFYFCTFLLFITFASVLVP